VGKERRIILIEVDMFFFSGTSDYAGSTVSPRENPSPSWKSSLRGEKQEKEMLPVLVARKHSQRDLVTGNAHKEKSSENPRKGREG